MRQRLAFLFILAAVGASAPAAAQTVQGAANLKIVEAAGILVTQDIATQVNTSLSALTVFGNTGDAVSMAVPTNVGLTSASGQSVTLATDTAMSLGGLLSQDAVNVTVGAIDVSSGTAPTGNYGGVMVVLAQYN